MSKWAYQKLDEYVHTGQIELGRGNIISKLDIDACPGPYPIYSSSAQGDGKFGEYGKFMFDEELISWSVDGGGNFFYRPKHQFSVTNVSGFLRIKTKEFGYRFLYYSLALQHRDISFDYTTKAHPSVIRKLYSIPAIPKQEQDRIVEVLSTVDEEIAQTEALIAKYQQIKAGLMHDLFTRGVTPNGHLRPIRTQAPHLYRESPLGWIPKEWETIALSHVADSLVDGPFGSNLKTEHYVVEPGVRVVRLQNIQEGIYNDEDRAFVSKRHADYLVRHTVNPGDVLVAALGEERYPVGRACCYPDDLPPSVNKADCYRLRCKSQYALNAYVMHFLNTENARKQVRRFEQGVTRRRMNLGNFRRVVVSQPTVEEQRRTLDFLSSVSGHIESAKLLASKLRQQKHGLMHDLLTGRVRVKVAEAEEKL